MKGMVLADLIKENLILLGVEAGTREEALRRTSQRLLEQGFVKETFYSALLEREAEYPTGLVLPTCGIAIPHVTPEHVNRSGIAVAVLKNTVKFRRVDDPEAEAEVKIIFNIALDRNGKQVEVLQKLMEFISDETVLAGMTRALSADDIIQLVGKVV
ncbi:MAG: PTS sugar transporter subunit IIA [Enterocloster asparagiformis]|nr:PTS sugar transporter subunit IIA [Enterocloster asparagiformis]